MTSKDFTTISPSAKGLLLLKGLTTIPFAKQAAELISLPGKYVPDYSNNDPAFWGRVVHFESRYQSIDQLLEDLPVKNILELSSGFSFRGLALAAIKDIQYIDTDLPLLIETKKDFTKTLQAGIVLTGKLETLPLNALDEDQFNELVNRFPPGEIVIVNEGLLMYLNVEEKKKLFSIIHAILQKRGGYWITADIYVKLQNGPKLPRTKNDALEKFFEQHKIEENKFESIEQAKEFFEQAGFVIDKISQTDYTKVTSLQYLRNTVSPEQLQQMRGSGKMNETWRVRCWNKSNTQGRL